jgi:hypothetical protein
MKIPIKQKKDKKFASKEEFVDEEFLKLSCGFASQFSKQYEN